MRKSGMVFVALLAVIVVGFGAAAGDTLRIWHFDVDQADSTLIVTPGGHAVLIDCGEGSWNGVGKSDAVAAEIAQILPRPALDMVILTHLAVDHVGMPGHGGVWRLLEVHEIAVGSILTRDFVALPGNTAERTYEEWRAYLSSTASDFLWSIPSLGQVFDFGDGVSLTVCSIDGNGAFDAGADGGAPEENDLCLGVLVSYGEYQEWIGGDLSGAIEIEAARHIGDVEVLRVNHHGSKNSSGEVFLGNLDPEVSIISVGEGNRYEHPHTSTLDGLLATSDVYITAACDGNPVCRDAAVAGAGGSFLIHWTGGNIVVETDGAAYWVNGTEYTALTPDRIDSDGDGYFVEVDPDDEDPSVTP